MPIDKYSHSPQLSAGLDHKSFYIVNLAASELPLRIHIFLIWGGHRFV